MNQTVKTGKHKGLSFEQISEQPDYCKWLRANIKKIKNQSLRELHDFIVARDQRPASDQRPAIVVQEPEIHSDEPVECYVCFENKEE